MKKDQKKFKFNALDTFVVLFVLLLISAIFFYFLYFASNDSNTETQIEYTLEISKAKSEFKDAVKIGDSLIDSSRFGSLGVVTDVIYEAATTLTTNKESGESILVQYPTNKYIKIIIKVKTDANIKDNVYYSENVLISIGNVINFRTSEFIGSAYCTSIKLL